jgi:4-hydroxymandelate oxidase
MYLGGPRDTPAGRPPLTGAARREFPGASDLAFDPQLRLFLADLVRPYDLPLREDLLERGAGQSYGEMAEELIGEIVTADEPVDLLVLAFGIHDVRLGRSTAAYLSDVCPGDPMAFAVCDQGAAAPFTALRLIGEYGAGRSLLVVAEQAALHYLPAGPAVVPDRHAAVALLFESDDSASTVVRQHPDVSSRLAGPLLAEDVAALSGGRSDVTLVLGGGLAPPPGVVLADRIVSAPAGQPYTGPWWTLAGGLADWRAEGRRVVVAEYDPALRYLSTSGVDVGVPAVAA